MCHECETTRWSGEPPTLSISTVPKKLETFPLWEVPRIDPDVLLPTREIINHPSRRSNVVDYSCISDGRRHRGDSSNEVFHFIRLDRDEAVVSLAAQPLLLAAAHPDDETKTIRHFVDILAALVDGRIRLVDCKYRDLVSDDDRLKFAMTRYACDHLGWDYEIAHELSIPERTNLRFLRAYASRRCSSPEQESRILTVLREPMSVDQVLQATGDRQTMAPPLFHMIWNRRIETPLMKPISGYSKLRLADLASK